MKYFLTVCLQFCGLFILAQTDTQTPQLKVADFTRAEADISIFPEEKKVEGDLRFSFDVLEKTDSIFLDAHHMKFSEVRLNGKPVDFENTDKKLWITKPLEVSKNNKLSFHYSVYPSQTMYFVNWNVPENENVTRQVWTQGQGKYTSYWLPSFDDLNEKLEFDLNIEFDKKYKVIANGELKKKKEVNDSITRWEFDMDKPMSSYLLAVAAGNYREMDFTSTSGVPVKLYFSPEDSLKLEPTYRYSEKIFNFLEDEIGFKYPWQNYKQIPVQDFLYAGMENTGTTIFSNSLMTDSIGFKDQNYVNVNAHELAHQWFGDLVTEENGKHHWLQEGFATYYALLAERQIFGDDYYYWKLYETAEQLKNLSDKGKGEALLKDGATSLTVYQKGAWALHILREKVGDEAFKEAIRNYLQRYKFENVNTDEFLSEVEKASGQDLSEYKKNWLEQSAFRADDALNSLKKSQFIQDYLQIAALRETPFSQKKELLSGALDFPVNDYIGQEVVFQLAGELPAETAELYKKAFKSNNIFVRQAIAMSLDKIPVSLKKDYESLLSEESYLTQEAALLNLWMQFPEDRVKYLQETRGTIGFFNKNVKMLWLTLNLATPEFDRENQALVYEELSGYTAPQFPVEVRENALGYLYQLDAFNEQNLRDLLEGTQHFNHKFREFSRKLLDELLQSPEYHKKYVALSKTLPHDQKEYLSKKISD